MITKELGKTSFFSKDEAEALLQLKTKWGIKDPRLQAENCELCANDMFRDSWKETGVGHRAFDPPRFRRNDPDKQPCGCASNPILNNNVELGKDPQTEALVKAIADRVVETLSKK